MYKALFFDIDDTLLNYERCSREALRKTLHCFNILDNDKANEFFRLIDIQLWTKQKQGELSVNDVLEMRFSQLFERLGIREYNPKFQFAYQEKLAKEFITEPNAVETIQYFSIRYKIFAASNGILKMQQKRMESAGLLQYFSDLFVSDDIGYEKPCVYFFNECLKRSQLKNSEVLFIGDSIEADIVGAYNSGIASCWYNPKRKDNYSRAKISYTISDLSELRTILQ